MTRWKIKFHGPVSAPLVGWMQALIPVIREAPEDIEIVIEIQPKEETQ